MPAGNRTPGVPANLGVIMGMQVNKPGGDNQAVRLNDALRSAGRPTADLGDFSILDPDIGLKARDAHPVNNRSPFDMNIKLSHGISPLILYAGRFPTARVAFLAFV